jgi:hypothetical protein
MMADRDPAEWDAEIEAEFQQVVRAAKAAGQRKHGQRHVGVPIQFLVDVCRLTEGRTTLVVALLIYRRTKIARSLTVTLPGSELAMLGINRFRKREALAKLEAAGLIRLERAAGRTTKVTLTWQPD